MTDPWMPASQDVARWIARLTGSGDAGLAYDFTTETVPTSDQVALIIDQASAEVVVSSGITADSPYIPWARQIIALEAAAQVVLSYDPQAVELANQLHAWYETALGRLLALARPGTSNGGSTQPIAGYVGTPGTIQWEMPVGPFEWFNSIYARPIDQFDLWFFGAWPYEPSFRNV